ncbi:MAG: hypothetical protein ABIJ97_04600 [Bacteroidota bacterium]
MKAGYYSISIVFFILICCTNSCYYDKEDELYPVNSISSCDTSNVCFSKDILPIIYGHCYNCHSEEKYVLYGGNVSLENYTDVKKSVDDESFIGSISYNIEYIGMPVDYQLDSCSLKKANIWVENGAQNN